ncbi:unnamed protein product [Sphenostylis stenocarpa]|uniref:Saposin B-type domain-containing protein n=1 Tax=Sphenostylis stenocarpa TaxID=92480 RepID=A0AA86VVD0_9FABA|nr:unnamed protein product [Sphenostylis stenocarpa]
MEGRMGLLFIVILGAAWACDARKVANLDQMRNNTTNSGTSELKIKPDLCALCEEFTTKALDYLKQNKTNQEIIDILHNTCHLLPSFKQKCTALVDYYIPTFLSEVDSIQPREFCHKIIICQQIEYISLQVQEDTCEFCEETVSTLLAKLKDSDTKLEIIEALLKVCNSVEKYANKCKKMVLEYGVLVFDNAEKFLENLDICTSLVDFSFGRERQRASQTDEASCFCSWKLDSLLDSEPFLAPTTRHTQNCALVTFEVLKVIYGLNT